MDTDQLISALSEGGNVPSADAVMSRFRGKQRRRAQVRKNIGGCAAAAAVIALVTGVVTALPRTGGPASGSSGAAGSAAAAPAPGHRSASGSAGSGASLAVPVTCGPLTLPERLAAAARAGASVVLAAATFTGHTVNGYDVVALRDVRTLHGPRIASGTAAWLPADMARAMLPGDGPLFAIVWPASPPPPALVSDAPGPVLTAAPVSGGRVLLSTGGCWGSTPDMPLSAVERLVSGK
jgi:hypothetical protein